jgi:HlyD family secretion protein
MNRQRLGILVLALLLAGLTACSPFLNQTATNGSLTASGTISAREVSIAPEIGGKVAAVSVDEGQQVAAGAQLFKLDGALLQAQRDQAASAVQVAEAALQAAQSQQDSAQNQYDLTLQTSRQKDQQNRIDQWKANQPTEFKLPAWYFQKDEDIKAAQQEVTSSETALQSEMTNLKNVLGNASSGDFVAAEQRLAEAQVAFQTAKQVKDQADQATNNESLKTQAQKQLDDATAALNAAQESYNRLLTSTASQDVLEARARVAVAQERHATALDQLDALQTGEYSPQVKVAEAGLNQAKDAVSQAQANLAQAQAALKAADVQIAKLTVTAPMNGVVLTRNLEVGESVAPGSTVMTIGQLNEVELLVYIPEDRYGEVHLGEKVEVRVDSFPQDVFNGQVTYISDQAEFTPRNVQTVEGRRATVYAIKLLVPNPDMKLKPGMPADVTFTGQ